jgi:hypothetical protein
MNVFRIDPHEGDNINTTASAPIRIDPIRRIDGRQAAYEAVISSGAISFLAVISPNPHDGGTITISAMGWRHTCTERARKYQSPYLPAWQPLTTTRDECNLSHGYSESHDGSILRSVVMIADDASMNAMNKQAAAWYWDQERAHAEQAARYATQQRAQI